jgi:hypothetical protein
MGHVEVGKIVPVLFHVTSPANELGFYLGLATEQRTKLQCVKVPLAIARAS